MIPKEVLGKRAERLPEPDYSRENTALLVIDMQYEDAHPDYGVCERLRSRGDQTVLDYYVPRLGLITPNIARLLQSFRHQGMEVVYTRVESLPVMGAIAVGSTSPSGRMSPPDRRVPRSWRNWRRETTKSY